MTVVKRLGKQRKTEIISQINNARLALDVGDQGSCLYALDKAMKLFNGWDDSERGTMRYDELHDACQAFLEGTGFPTLAVAHLYIDHWRSMEERHKEAMRLLSEAAQHLPYVQGEEWPKELLKETRTFIEDKGAGSSKEA